MPRNSKPHWHRGRLRVRIGGQELYLADGRNPAEFASMRAYERAALREFHHLATLAQPDQPGKPNRPTSVGTLLTRWQKLHPDLDTEYRLRPFAQWLHYASTPDLLDIPLDLLERYQAALRRRSYRTHNAKTQRPRRLSPKSINDRLGVAAAIFRDAVAKGWLDRMPSVPRRLKVAPNPRGLSPETVRAVLERLPPHAQLLCIFIDAVGCRTDEACRLRWEHLRRDATGRPTSFSLPEHKSAGRTGRSRVIYLTPCARKLLKPRSRGPVFVNRFGRPYQYSGIRSILRRASQAIGLDPPLTPHQLRHSFAQRMAQSEPVQVLSTLLGHADVSQTQRYYYVEEAQAVAAAQRATSSMQSQGHVQPAAAERPRGSARSARRARNVKPAGPDGSARRAAARRRA